MDNNLKRAWRIISPVVFYLIIERIVGFLINFYYIMGRLDEDTAWSDALENQLYQEIYELQKQKAHNGRGGFESESATPGIYVAPDR